ncbi:hypothetical protein ILUMI_22994 [Ignelater luminosus]|uniref:Uncharacterized protein n=1 Tax=Ignelater luminosus TaxID=2038154 RepID=A0A8K0CFH9_IGNLU|nr:hypothetical protein ILUMI_22994 [Ignelater luminosus]
MGFNKPAVNMFFAKYEQLLQRFHYDPESIYNTDETALTTVQDSIKVLATTGQKQVGQVTSTERGTLITMCGTINALGNSILPATHRLQPLDRSIYGPLKKCYNDGCMSWSILWLFPPATLSQPSRKRDCIHLIVFDDSEFLASSVAGIVPNETTATSLTSVITNTSLDAPSTSSSVAPTNNCYERPVMPPHQRSTQVLTDTPIRNELAEIENVKRNQSKPTKEKKVDFSGTSSDSAQKNPIKILGAADMYGGLLTGRQEILVASIETTDGL